MFEDSAVAVYCCPVRPGLAKFLTVRESESMLNCANIVRDRAAAARLAAKELLGLSGISDWQLPRKHGDAPDWPPGWTGSLSHSDEYAVAALAPSSRFAGIGIDIEPAEPLPTEIRDTVICGEDVVDDNPDNIDGRILFCAKEAIYKAVYPVDRRFLEFREVCVDLESGVATTCYGRRASFSVHLDHRVVVLAEIDDRNG